MPARFGAVACLVSLVATAAVAAPARASGRSQHLGCHPEWPVVTHQAARTHVRPAPPRGPVACAVRTGYATSESTIGLTPGGVILYSPAQSENSLARSVDAGKTWSLTYPDGEQYTALWNTDDPQLSVDGRTGRVFWVHATGPTRTTPVLVSGSPLPRGVSTAIAAAYGFQVYSSADSGRTWRTADYSTAPTGDWEKIFTGPPVPPRRGLPRRSGYPDMVYVCANSPLEVVGPGRLCYRSFDGGATFSPAGYVFPSATTPDACAAIATETGVVGGDGTMYEPVSCARATYLAISHDEGASYAWLRITGAPASGNLPGDVQVAIDRADNLYALWRTADHLSVAVSRDRAHTWSAPLDVGAPGVHDLTLPVIAAGPKGHVGVAYYGSEQPGSKWLSAYMTETDDATAAQPHFYSGVINDPSHPIYQPCSSCAPRADYVGGTYDARGTFWAGVVEQLGSPDAGGDVATVGYVGRLAFPD
jgi:hypothetical protein